MKYGLRGFVIELDVECIEIFCDLLIFVGRRNEFFYRVGLLVIDVFGVENVDDMF